MRYKFWNFYFTEKWNILTKVLKLQPNAQCQKKLLITYGSLSNNNIVPCWRYLFGITDSATQFPRSLFVSDFTVGITPLSSSNSRTRELSNRRLSNPRTVEPSNCRLSNSCIHLLIAHQSLASLEVLAPYLVISFFCVGPKVASGLTE
jgi:hypothetical protein